MKLSKTDIETIKEELEKRQYCLDNQEKLLKEAEAWRLTAKKFTHQAIANDYGVSKARIQHIKENIE